VRWIALLALLLPASSWACGQTTHVWVSLAALDELPSSALADILRAPANRDALVSGTMFPDGGYAVGDGYGEAAHWEPFQQALAARVRDQFGPDYTTPEGQLHLAFLMGLLSHGLSDEIFDTLFYDRSRQYDPGHDEEVTSLDTASDVTFAHDVGGIEPPDQPWVPYELVRTTFEEDLGYSVSVDTLTQGTELLMTALAFVDWARDVDERVETMTAEFPWAAERMNDGGVPGAPPWQTAVVAAYWAESWSRWSGAAWAAPVISSVPADGSWGHAREAGTVEAKLQLTFGRGVQASSFDRIAVTGPDGAAVPVNAHHFYGDGSHSVLLEPASDWARGEHRIDVGAGVLSFDGDGADAWSATFSTEPEPAIEEPVEPTGCSTGGVGGVWLLLLARRRWHSAARTTEA